MQGMINFADSLIYAILDYTLFFLYYGVIFYLLGSAILWILKMVYKSFSPTWKRWYQVIRSKFK